MRVLKFGGTSIANAERFLRVADILESNAKQGKQIAIVLSAPAKVTNYLVVIIEKSIDGQDTLPIFNDAESIFIELLKGLAQAQPGFPFIELQTFVEKEFAQIKHILHGITLLGQCPDNINASLICRGEKISTAIMAALLEARGYGVTAIDPVEKLLAVGHYLESTVDIAESARRIIASEIPSNHMILMAGFTGGNEKGELVLLGRDGSDYSAAVLAACLRAECCEIWKDVDGVYTCDPRQVPEARLLKSISYQEAMELFYFGAKVLHPRTISSIARFRIPCLLKNTSNPHAPGTLIGAKTNENEDEFPVKGISNLNNIAMFIVSGPGMNGMLSMASRVFSTMSRNGISVVLITQSSSEYSISFCVPQSDILHARRALEEEFYLELKEGLLHPVIIQEKLAIISIIGEGMRTLRGISAKIFSALSRANINIMAISQGSSECSVSVVVDNDNATNGVRVTHQILFNTSQIIEIFLIGVNGLGKALIEKIKRQQVWLKKKHIDLRICGIANSKTLLTNIHGINLENWMENLKDAKDPFNLDSLLNVVKRYHMLNPVIVDCTTSYIVASRYIDFLREGCHVVTSNKQANISSMTYYHQLRYVAEKSKRKFLYDTNVSAGLPVIENLQNLIKVGDKLKRFSGMLSSSLSFIFSKLNEGVFLSEAINMAYISGYSDPCIREDLSGMNIASKLLILARESGLFLELSDVQIESIIPVEYNNAFRDTETFIDSLVKFNNNFSSRIITAHGKGKILSYIGSIDEDGICQVKIAEIDSSDPLFRVNSGENVLVFYSNYYHSVPLVLRGYGEGNEIMSAGVFVDILRTLS